jgi:hypothetical protein
MRFDHKHASKRFTYLLEQLTGFVIGKCTPERETYTDVNIDNAPQFIQTL